MTEEPKTTDKPEKPEESELTEEPDTGDLERIKEPEATDGSEKSEEPEEPEEPKLTDEPEATDFPEVTEEPKGMQSLTGIFGVMSEGLPDGFGIMPMAFLPEDPEDAFVFEYEIDDYTNGIKVPHIKETPPFRVEYDGFGIYHTVHWVAQAPETGMNVTVSGSFLSGTGKVTVTQTVEDHTVRYDINLKDRTYTAMALGEGILSVNDTGNVGSGNQWTADPVALVPVIDKEFTVIWNDNNDEKGHRPSGNEVSYTLLANGVPVVNPEEEIDTSSTIQQVIRYQNLPEFDDEGKPIVYTLEQSGTFTDHYVTEEIKDEEGIITGYRNTLKTSIEVTKHWKDFSTRSATRPDQDTWKGHINSGAERPTGPI